jgi:hypothetical protein
VSFYEGFNNLPDFDVSGPEAPSGPLVIARVYPPIRSYGADAAVPLPWFAIKGEAAYVTSPTSDEYLLYVLQLEKQRGEWLFLGGYVGEVTTRKRAALFFAPDRGLSRSIVARASYTIDANRRVELESAVRQNGDGVYAKAEYSQARGQHWRATVSAVVLAGERDDFIGQYRRNSHVRLTIRYSY